MASAEREAITGLTGVWGGAPSGGRAPGQGSGGPSPPEAKAFCLSQVQMERKFASFCYLVNCSNMLFWATVCKTVRAMLLDRCLSVCPVCDVGVLWPNGWMDQHATWYGGRPPPWPHCVRWGPSSPKGHNSPQFSTHVYCGQTAGWIKMPLGTEVGLGGSAQATLC